MSAELSFASFAACLLLYQLHIVMRNWNGHLLSVNCDPGATPAAECGLFHEALPARLLIRLYFCDLKNRSSTSPGTVAKVTQLVW